VAVGYGIGADPLRMLLHTPVGAACVGLACAFQLAGLLWTERLSRVDL
jgi:tight adherence protein B